MDHLILFLSSALVLGVGATLTFDLWGQFLKLAFKLAPSNICLVGRWLRYMPEGTFRHANIAQTPRRPAECALGWAAHYFIGLTFAGVFVTLAGPGWLEQPTPLPALAFGLVTVLAPFLIMQPLMGLGVASARAPNPALARARTLMNHVAFGVGLYVFAWLLRAA